MRTRMTYKSTMTACFFGIFMQAVIANLLSVLFIPMKELYGLSFIHLGILVGVIFVSQVIADVIFSGLIDRIGYRPLAIGASITAMVGLILLTLTPLLFSSAIFAGLLISSCVFAFSGGLLEVLLSPIVDSFPQNKGGNGGAMAFMHSFYAWGQAICIVITTLFVFFFGGKNWQWITAFWAALPLIPLLMFCFVPLQKTLQKKERTAVKKVAFSKFFIVCMLAILFGAASEVTMNQWASGFVEKGLAVPKIWGDLLGMCMFAVMMGVGRLLHGVFGKRFKLSKILIGCSCVTLVCYLITAVSPFPALSVLTCALTGLGASLLWPGVISTAADRFPLAGGWMFAILATAGDIGAGLFPAITGAVVDGVAGMPLGSFAAGLGLTMEQLALRAGILFGAICPIAVLICHIILHRMGKKHQAEKPAEQEKETDGE